MLGAGAWGTTLANLLAEGGREVALWSRRDAHAESLARERENRMYLPGVPLHAGVRPTQDLAVALGGSGLVVMAVPSHRMRAVAARAAAHLAPETLVVSASKGIENETLLRMTEVLEEALPAEGRVRLAVLSGPSFAGEVSQHRPTAVTVAAPVEAVAGEAREHFARPYFRVYTSTDVVGVELGGALKNVIAIASGVADGLQTGHNGRAALITRGMAEISRLGRVLGADPLTLSGLSGAGDLILTCTSSLSRNYTVGVRLGGGERLKEILADMREVAEGVKTAASAFQLAGRENVEMPIVSEVYSILYEEKSPTDALAALMARESKAEFWV